MNSNRVNFAREENFVGCFFHRCSHANILRCQQSIKNTALTKNLIFRIFFSRRSSSSVPQNRKINHCRSLAVKVRCVCRILKNDAKFSKDVI